jgi:hypothetical protein
MGMSIPECNLGMPARRSTIDRDGILAAAQASGIPYTTLYSRMKRKGLTLEQALAMKPMPHGQRNAQGFGGKRGGRKEPSMLQYFVDAVRACMGKDPLYER